LAALMSAGPSSRPRSDGLIGVASTLTKTGRDRARGTAPRSAIAQARRFS
jgi:hypothetical protein